MYWFVRILVYKVDDVIAGSESTIPHKIDYI